MGLALRSVRLVILYLTPRHRRRLVSTLLAAIAEFERDLIKERTGDGRAPSSSAKSWRDPPACSARPQELTRKFRAPTPETAKVYAPMI